MGLTVNPMDPHEPLMIVKIHYANRNNEFSFQDRNLPTKEEIAEHWVELPDWVYENLAEDGMCHGNLCENIFRRMNSYDTNPLAEEYPNRIDSYEEFTEPKLLAPENPRIGQDWLRDNDVGHTSMSVGDIIEVCYPENDPRYPYKGAGLVGKALEYWLENRFKEGFYYTMRIGFKRLFDED